MKTKLLHRSGKLSQFGIGNEPRPHYPPDGSLFAISESAIELMPETVARENYCFPLGEEGGRLHIAHHAFDDIHLQDKLRFILNRDVVFHVWPRDEIMRMINRFYGQRKGESADGMLQEFTDTAIDFTENVNLSSKACLESSPRLSQLNQLRASRNGPEALGANNNTRTKTIHHNSYSGDGMFFYTIEEGRKALAYRSGGRIEVVEGPARMWKGFSRFELMRHYIAHPGEFMVIRFRDGTQQNIKGPTEVWFDPRIHETIAVEQGLTLAAKEAVVVYGEDSQGTTQREIQYGPGVFMPKPGQWLHDFSWHASHGGSQGAEKIPNGLRFQKLWLMPDQMYHDVRDVRTADDAVLVIRLMIFFELLDIEKMLDTTHDPIGDFINAATSDVVEFTGRFTFEEFKKQTEHLNELSTYTQLLHRAEQSGYQINNVVYRGYGAPESLQKMHDEAIAARTSLQLDKDTEKQTQELEDYRLRCQVERSDRRRLEQTTEVEHDLMLQEKRKNAELEALQLQQQAKLELRRKESELQQEISLRRDQSKRTHLAELKSMGVELTEYLTQGRADQVIELRGQDSSPHLHLKQPASGNPKC